jgi:hypothetical protein
MLSSLQVYIYIIIYYIYNNNIILFSVLLVFDTWVCNLRGATWAMNIPNPSVPNSRQIAGRWRSRLWRCGSYACHIKSAYEHRDDTFQSRLS